MTRLVPLAEVVLTATGSRNPAAQPEIEFTYVDVAAVDNQSKKISGAKTMIGADAPSRARKILCAGDVLVSTVRPNLNAVALVPETLDGQVASTGFCVLRAKRECVLPEYLFYFVRSKSFVDCLTALVSGAMYPAVTDRQVLDQKLPVPSLDEQRRIVDLLSRAEGIVRLRREAQAKAQAIIPALFLDMFGDPAKNPKGWPIKDLWELAAIRSGGTPSKARDDFWVGDLPWVSPKDMKRPIIRDAVDHVSSLVLTETNLKLIPTGSILIVVRGMILLHTVPIALTAVPVTINQDMKALIPHSGVEPTFLLWAMKVLHPHLLRMVTTAAHGTKKLDTERLEGLTLPVPPLKFQQAFERQCRAAFGIVARQTEALRKAEAAFQAILARAFNVDLAATAFAEEAVA